MVDKLAADAPAASPEAPVLDELMMAMDVVDTLRHQEYVALRELEQDGRDADLKARLRRIYEGQGLAVSDRILEEGIRALKESRFTYEPTPSGLPRTLAGIWVRRAAIGKAVAVLALVLAVWAGWTLWREAGLRQEAELARIELTETLPRQIDGAGRAALAEAMTEDARERVEQLQADAAAALSRADAEAARVVLAELERVREALVQTYELRIVSRPGEDTGVYRVPDINTGARNYYLIVEAVTPGGEVLSFPVTSEEDGRTRIVRKWGVRVPESTFESVRRDKMDDGIVQDNVLGRKPRGHLNPVYEMNVSGGAITQW